MKAGKFGDVFVNGGIKDGIKFQTSDDLTKKEHINYIKERTKSRA